MSTSNLSTVAALAALKSPTKVGRIFGEIAKVFPTKPFPGGRFVVNFRLRDPESSQEIEAGLWNRSDIDLAKCEGGFIEVSGDLNFKSTTQRLKLEIETGATVVRLLKPAEYPGWMAIKSTVLGSSSSGSIPFPSPSNTPLTPKHVTIPEADAHQSEEHNAASEAESEVKQLAVLGLLCMNEARWAVDLASKNGEIKTQELHRDLSISMFVQATRDGSHKRIDLDAFLSRLDPAALDSFKANQHPLLNRLLAEIGDETKKAENMLRAMGKISDGKKIQDLTEMQVASLFEMNFHKLLKAS